jgi:hypothetical protein
VTVGRVVVVVGGRVVDGGADRAGASAELGSTAVVVVVGGAVVEVVEDEAFDGRIRATGEFTDPGCSRATRPPMTAVAPVAVRTAVEVRRRILVCARSGETDPRDGRRILVERSIVLAGSWPDDSRGGCRGSRSSRPAFTIERGPDAKMTSAAGGRHPLVIHDG